MNVTRTYCIEPARDAMVRETSRMMNILYTSAAGGLWYASASGSRVPCYIFPTDSASYAILVGFIIFALKCTK